MAKRHKDAIAIQQGACNPSGVALSIVAACKEIREEPNYAGTAQITSDPAVRLMVHQLAFLCHVAEIDGGFDVYAKLMRECDEPADPEPEPPDAEDTSACDPLQGERMDSADMGEC